MYIQVKDLLEQLSEIKRALTTRGSFVQNSAWMFASSGISIFIQFAFFFILARIYSPEQYGVFGVFNVYITTLGTAATLGLTQAFVLPRKDREFSALLRLTIIVSVLFCLLTALVFTLAGESILHLFGHEVILEWTWLIAPTTFVMALDRITADWAIRNKEFRKQTTWSTLVTLATKSFNVFYGVAVSATAGGLILTTLLQHLLRALTYGVFVIEDGRKQLMLRIRRTELMHVAREYKEFPLYIHWANLINIFSNNLPAAMITPLGFGIENVGYYAYSLIVLDLPIRLMGSGISSVFMQKAAELVHERKEELARHTWRLYQIMVAGCLIFSVIVCVSGEFFYSLLLEDQWRTAGIVAEILVISYFFRMISIPLSSLFNILRKEKQFFSFQIILTIARFVSLLAGAAAGADFIALMWIYSLTNAAAYLILALWIFRLLDFSQRKVLGFTIAWTIAGFGAAYGLKFFL